MQFKNLLFAAVLCVASSVVYAATDETLGEVTVTATRLKQPLNQSLSSATVINEQDIRDSQAPDVSTILRRVCVDSSSSGTVEERSGGPCCKCVVHDE